MSEEPTFEQMSQALLAYLNNDNRAAVLAYARVPGGAPWAQDAEVTAIDAAGLEVAVSDGHGRQESRRVDFERPVTDGGQLRLALMELADRADPPDGLIHAAGAHVTTTKAPRYLKALCNHFDRKAEATYDDTTGRISFPFGECDLRAEGDALLIRVAAGSATRLRRVQHVVADHLVRFAQKEELSVTWNVAEPTAATVP